MTTSVGWVGAVGVFLALAAIGLTSPDAQTARGAYLVMDRAAWLVLLPLALASLASGVLQSFVTQWGLFRHYWVLFKLLINLFAVAVLLMYMDTFRSLAGVAATPGPSSSPSGTRPRCCTRFWPWPCCWWPLVLAIYKPRGLTRTAGGSNSHIRIAGASRTKAMAPNGSRVP